MSAPCTTLALFALLLSAASAALTCTSTTNTCLHLLSGKPGKCLDGSPGGFYYRPATTSGDATKWFIYFQGGGAAVSQADAKRRTRSKLGSSTKFSQTVKVQVGTATSWVLEAAQSWNLVQIPYCSGDTHCGNRADTAAIPDGSGDTTKFYWQGRMILDSVLETLNDEANLGAATRVVVSGNSAGGKGVLTNIDRIASYVRTSATSNVVVKGVARSGWFLPFKHGSDFAPSAAAFKSGARTGGIKALSDLCTVWGATTNFACEQAETNKYDCCMASILYPYISTPLFVHQNKYDKNQVTTQLGAQPGKAPYDDLVAEYGRRFEENVVQLMDQNTGKAGKDAYYLPSCSSHGSATSVANKQQYQVYANKWIMAPANAGEAAIRFRDTCAGMDCQSGCGGGSGSSGGSSGSGGNKKGGKGGLTVVQKGGIAAGGALFLLVGGLVFCRLRRVVKQ